MATCTSYTKVEIVSLSEGGRIHGKLFDIRYVCLLMPCGHLLGKS